MKNLLKLLVLSNCFIAVGALEMFAEARYVYCMFLFKQDGSLYCEEYLGNGNIMSLRDIPEKLTPILRLHYHGALNPEIYLIEKPHIPTIKNRSPGEYVKCHDLDIVRDALRNDPDTYSWLTEGIDNKTQKKIYSLIFDTLGFPTITADWTKKLEEYAKTKMMLFFYVEPSWYLSLARENNIIQTFPPKKAKEIGVLKDENNSYILYEVEKSSSFEATEPYHRYTYTKFDSIDNIKKRAEAEEDKIKGIETVKTITFDNILKLLQKHTNNAKVEQEKKEKLEKEKLEKEKLEKERLEKEKKEKLEKERLEKEKKEREEKEEQLDNEKAVLEKKLKEQKTQEEQLELQKQLDEKEQNKERIEIEQTPLYNLVFAFKNL